MAALTAVVALCASVPALAAPARRDSVLVKLDPAASPFARAAVGGALRAESWRTLPNGWREYRLGAGVTLATARARLRQTTADTAVELDQVLRPAVTPNDPLFSGGLAPQYAPQLIHAPEAWDVTPRAPAPLIAVVDSGIDPAHEDLVQDLWTGINADAGLHGWNFSNGRSNSTLFTSAFEDEHGTHVAGIIGAQGGNLKGVAGIAGVGPRSQLMTVKFMYQQATLSGPIVSGNASDAINALDWAIQRHARVINASWGAPASLSPQALCDEVVLAAQSSLVVVAAGNAGENTDVVPDAPGGCASDGVITVASTSADDSLSTFSNYGPTSIDMGAPGDSVLSTLPLNGYGELSGTSMAAPQVSGVAALMLSQDPFLTPAELRIGLMNCGDPVPSLIGKTVSGRRLNALNSVQQAESLRTAADGVPPCPFALLGPTDGSNSEPRPVFSWQSATDLRTGVASYRVLVDGQEVAQTPATSVSAQPGAVLTQGSHTWTVQAIDGAGNIRTASTTRTVVVDSGPPEPFALTEPAAGLATRSRVPLLQWSATTDTGVGLAGYQLLVDGIAGPVMAPNVLASGPASPLPDGSHTWQVRALDALNQARDSEVRSFLVDTVAPKPFFLRSPVDGARIGTRRPSLLWSRTPDPGSGRVTFVVLVDGKPRAKSLTKPSWRTAAPLRRGRHTWRVRAVDAAGNTRLSPPGTFVIR